MGNSIRQKLAKGKKIKQFRVGNHLSMVNLSTITGISVTAISRIENGGDYNPVHLDTICSLMGITAKNLLKTDISEISKKAVSERIAIQLKKNGITKTGASKIKYERENYYGPSRLVKRTIEDGFLQEYRVVSEIKEFIEIEYGVTLHSSSITNALNRKKGIMSKKSGVADYKAYMYGRSLNRPVK